MEQPVSQQKLPAGLAGVLNHPEDQRDSAYFSIQDPSSKHTSTQSSNGGPIPTPPSYQSSIFDKTPSPITTNHHTQPFNSPTGGMSVASMVSPTSPDGQSIHNRFSRPSYDSGPMSAGLSMNGEDSSRRQSMSSTLGINELNLSSTRSPYASNNQSTTSIQSTLLQQRNPGAHQDRNSLARLSNSYAPHNQRLPDTLSSPLSPGRHIGGAAPKTAPTITGPALGNIARAPEPTKGQAWAFPEEEVQKLPSAARPSDETSSRQPSYLDSRRSSMADSIASSQFTTESRLPAGQRRLEDGMPPDYTSSELQTHHHSLANKYVVDLRNDGDSPTSTQPYSRTPELRVSHKLAERKRRTEMKDLFDTLRDLMPQERGSKASKWEILTKAISEHQRLLRDVNEQRQATAMVTEQAETSRREANTLRLENTQLRHELGRLSGGYQGDQRVNGAPHKGAELPPIRGSFLAEDSMTGVQYNESPMHMSRPQPQVERRGNGFPYQNERPHVGSMFSEPSQNGYQPQQTHVNGFQHSEHSRSTGLKF